jgi:EpsI family protein
MQKIKQRYLTVILILALLSIPTHLLTYDVFHKSESSVKALSGVPLEMGDWRGRDVFLEEYVYKLLETKAIIHRSYRSNKGNVFLSVVYYADTKVGFHEPEGCLGAKGLELEKAKMPIVLANRERITVNELKYQRESDNELVYYFYKAGGYLGDSYLKLRLNLALNKLMSRSKSGALIRVSTPILTGSAQSAQKTLFQFLEAFYPYMMQAL